ncbi:nucleoside triphosphate pyrophosphatase [Cellvibrio sp. pealriver]|uniref:Maf family protein n=1 Tax=Cellvibrio sp. pealriver TaxID=1622269 RepID=UPI00066FDBA5|nr:Maf family protein [Cellvibrio sp. pealriver]
MSAIHPDLYLASQSPRRRELLRQIGVRHQVINVSVPEQPAADETAMDYVQRLSREKAAAGYAQVVRQGLFPAPVLGADTLGLLDGIILEKPRDQAHAFHMLRQLSGCTHQVITAITLHSAERQVSRVSITDVTFRELNEAEITAYWQTGEPQDKAGSYAIQGLGAVFVKEIRGSYSNVVGLPLEATYELLQGFSIPWWTARDSSGGSLPPVGAEL